MYDAIPARDITPPEGVDVLSIIPDEECQASFENKLYPARVVAVGKYARITVCVHVSVSVCVCV